MKIGRLEIHLQWRWHKKKRLSQGRICDICGQSCPHGNKAGHVRDMHPEYKFSEEQVMVENNPSLWSLLGRTHQYRVYKCGFCEYKQATPAYLIKHIQECHKNLLVRGLNDNTKAKT